MGRRKNQDSCSGVGTFCGTPLAFAGTLWHRVIINKESSWRVAADLGFQNNSVLGVVRLLKACGYCPSKERLAVAAMIVPDVSDQDIDEWFGKERGWAKEVRAKSDYWRLAEPFNADLEYIDDGYQRGDPSPAEIAERCQNMTPIHAGRPKRRVETSQYQWNGKRGTFFPICIE